MSLESPSMWIKKRGRQHPVYWRNAPGSGLPTRSYQRLYSWGDAEQFISMAVCLGLATAREVMATEDVGARRALLCTALAERGLVPTRPAPAAAPAPQLPAAFTPPAAVGMPAGSRPTGVTFRQL